MGEFPAAISCFNESNKYRTQHNLFPYWRNYNEIRHIHSDQEKFDSALYAYGLALSTIKLVFKDSIAKISAIMEVLGNKADVYLKMMDHSNALALTAQLLDYYTKEKNGSEIMKGLRRMARAYMIRKDYAKALQYGRASLDAASAKGSHQGVKEGAALLSELYDNLNRADSAWFYHTLSSTGKDSTAINSLNNNLTFYKAMKQNEADETRLASLRQENRTKQQRLDFLFVSIMRLLLLVFFFYRNGVLQRKNDTQKHALLQSKLQLQQLESEKTHLEFQQESARLEMKALRAQMNRVLF